MAEAAVESGGVVVASPSAVAARDHVAVHRAQVLEEVGLLLEHGDAQPACEGLLARMHAEVRLEVPAHAELLAAVLTPVLPRRRGLPRALAGGAVGGFGRLGQGALPVPGGGGAVGAGAGAAAGALLRTAGRAPPSVAVPLAQAQAAAAVRALILGDQVVVGRGEAV